MKPLDLTSITTRPTRITSDFSKKNAPTHWLPYYLQMLRMQQRLTTNITNLQNFWTEKEPGIPD